MLEEDTMFGKLADSVCVDEELEWLAVGAGVSDIDIERLEDIPAGISLLLLSSVLGVFDGLVPYSSSSIILLPLPSASPCFQDYKLFPILNAL